MKRPFFFAWYYNKGLQQVLEIWKNFLFFSWRYFSVAELLLTLFAPWHRDVEIRNWRGWNPLRSSEMLIENFFSRLIGLIVRLVVISIGLIFFVEFNFARAA